MFFRPQSECVCQHEPGQQLEPQPLQTLSHVFLECPVAVEVWDWFLRLWRRIAPFSIVTSTHAGFAAGNGLALFFQQRVLAAVSA